MPELPAASEDVPMSAAGAAGRRPLRKRATHEDTGEAKEKGHETPKEAQPEEARQRAETKPAETKPRAEVKPKVGVKTQVKAMAKAKLINKEIRSNTCLGNSFFIGASTPIKKASVRTLQQNRLEIISNRQTSVEQ